MRGYCFSSHCSLRTKADLTLIVLVIMLHPDFDPGDGAMVNRAVFHWMGCVFHNVNICARIWTLNPCFAGYICKAQFTPSGMMAGSALYFSLAKGACLMKGGGKADNK